MKPRLWGAGLLMVLVSMSLHATTLKLAPEIDLLVLDGRKISGSLLKGADGLELEKGQHQFLFRIEKPLPGNGREAQYISVPLIATFIAEGRSVTIQLPPLNSSGDARRLDKLADFQLVDEQNRVIDSKRDRLNLSTDSDAEQAMIAYNRDNRIASVARFAEPRQTSSHGASLPPDIALTSQPDPTPLQRWYQQVDSATRKHLQRLIKALHTS